ncbi:MAG: thiamine pyrophosphate-dependent enzyme, partial [Planctomycetota bacterium]|nr:thiamine pyrophosphate-dependent enzyme [Planctomycetota bacterium]
TGDFHEGLNIAAVWKLPFILVIENNHWAFSTPTSQQYACDNLASRALGYGIPGVEVDGNDPLAVLEVMQKAVKRARAGEGPTLVEAHLGRHRGHSEGDDSLNQVPSDELKGYLDNDPMDLIEARLVSSGVVSRAWLQEIKERSANLIMEVVDEAVAMPEPTPNTDRNTYAD